MSDNNEKSLPSRSIHPRVHGGFAKFEKTNTTKQKRPSTIERAINAIEQHLERHPGDGQSSTHLSKLKSQS